MIWFHRMIFLMYETGTSRENELAGTISGNNYEENIFDWWTNASSSQTDLKFNRQCRCKATKIKFGSVGNSMTTSRTRKWGKSHGGKKKACKSKISSTLWIQHEFMQKEILAVWGIVLCMSMECLQCTVHMYQPSSRWILSKDAFATVNVYSKNSVDFIPRWQDWTARKFSTTVQFGDIPEEI